MAFWILILISFYTSSSSVPTLIQISLSLVTVITLILFCAVCLDFQGTSFLSVVLYVCLLWVLCLFVLFCCLFISFLISDFNWFDSIITVELDHVAATFKVTVAVYPHSLWVLMLNWFFYNHICYMIFGSFHGWLNKTDQLVVTYWTTEGLKLFLLRFANVAVIQSIEAISLCEYCWRNLTVHIEENWTHLQLNIYFYICI